MSDEPEVARITLRFVTSGVTATALSGSSLLRSSIREKGGIPFKCGGGLCGTCKCHFDEGLEHASVVTAKERKHLSTEDFVAGWRMACQTFVNGDATISWVPKP